MGYFSKLVFGLVAAVLVSLVPSVVTANVDSFVFRDFTADYYLSKDDQGRSNLKVVETLQAVFPQRDQNKGLVRYIPATYDGHSVSLQFESLTRNGQPEPIYSKTYTGGHLMVSTGTDDYVRGNQTYVFTYTLRDVTKDFGDHQEFYWDTNGTDWKQRFGSVTANLHIEGSAANLVDGQVACYEGVAGSNTSCQYSKDGSVLTFKSNGIVERGENLTMVVGFKPDSFEAYQRDSKSLILAAVTTLVGLTTLIGGVSALVARSRSAKGKGTIVPEYLPPDGISLMQASMAHGNKEKMFPAQIVDLAVRRKIQIIEGKKASLVGNSKTYSLKLLSAIDLTKAESTLLESTTGLTEGGTYELKSYDSKVAMVARALRQSMRKKMLQEGYTRKTGGMPKYLIVLIILHAVLAVVSFAILAGSGDNLLIAVIFVQIIVFGPFYVILLFVLYGHHPLTEKGAELRDYLKGMQMYIKVGEAERLRFLQSPQGAEKRSIDATDSKSIVRLYERMLPYAVLFGQEKEWAKVLDVQYQATGESPSWYSGSSAFHAGVIGSMIGSLSSSSINPSSSSSSSGFGGGGFSGGGGGGGGGGGR